ncbi:hypothetical protein MNV49_003843 [Pseudohyphozyma bogoriensis]|nr:hypothetical protein MNV49_003843 [Pseudohyphozyma bogoriensis]
MTVIANDVAKNVLGTIGAILWSTQMVPQIFSGSVFLGAYAVIQNLAVPLLIQPQLFCFFTVLAWAQCLYYDQGKSKRVSIASPIAVYVFAGGIEVGLVLGTRTLSKHAQDKAILCYGLLSAISIIAGLIPQYLEIMRLRAVIGISLIFLAVDMTGAVLSTLALAVSSGSFDILAAVSYCLAFGLELGVLILAAILNPIYYRRKKEEMLANEAVLAGTMPEMSTSTVLVQPPPPVAAV